MSRSLTLLIIYALLLAGCGTTPRSTRKPATTPTMIPTPMPGLLYVNPSQSLGPISPLIYGSNYGPWVTVTVNMLPTAYDSGVTILRFPAGSWGDNNDLQNYHIDSFMSFAKDMNASVMINARLLGGTPEQAAELVRYVNIEKKYNVIYWGIGNEPTLYNDQEKNFGRTYDIEKFNREWREFALAMKEIDPDIKLIGPEINQFSYDDAPGATTNFSTKDSMWLEEFLKANGDLVDIVSFHRYPFPRQRTSGSASIEELRANTQEWDKIIIHARELIHRETGYDLPIAITEFNSDYTRVINGEATPDSHYNAIWVGDVLGRMIKNGVFMANHWMLTSQGGSGGWGLVGRNEPYPAYYVYQLYKKFGDELIYSSSDDPDLSIYAAKRNDGTITIIVVNLALEAKEKAIQIEGQASVKAEAWLFDPNHKAESVGFADISGMSTFPPQSITLFIVP